jgi:hypothetical protein
LILIDFTAVEIITNTTKQENGELIYSESLTMRKMVWILLPVFLAVLLLPAAGLTMAEIQSKWAQDFWNMIAPIIILLSVFLLLWNVRLNWSISKTEFSFTFFPFVLKRRTYSMDDVDDIQVMKINSLKEFGGWGLRRGKLGKAYTTAGNHILHVKLKNGTPVNVSVLRPQQAQDFLDQLQLS